MLYLEPLLTYCTDNSTTSYKGIYEESLRFDLEKGMDGIFLYSAMEGFQVNYSNFVLTNDINVDLKVKEKLIEMHFSISGNLTSKNDDDKRSIKVTQLQHNLFSLPQEYNTNLILKADNQKIIKLDILLDPLYFKNILDEDNKIHQNILAKIEKNEVFFNNWDYYNISPKMFSILTEITSNQRIGYFKRLFLEAKIIELFMLQSEIMEKGETKRTVQYIKLKSDIEKIYYVKELIDADPFYDFSLNDISKRASINLFKLKNGFKEIFGTSVFGYINDIKMEMARTMLLEKELQVSEVAYILGYNSPTNFSTAFKRKFDISPKQLKNFNLL